MSDLISRDALLDVIGDTELMVILDRKAAEETGRWGVLLPRMEVLRRIMDAPAVDAVPVVRCRDCMFSRSYMTGNLYCELHENYPFGVYPESFCSRGAKKVGGADDGEG